VRRRRRQRRVAETGQAGVAASLGFRGCRSHHFHHSADWLAGGRLAVVELTIYDASVLSCCVLGYGAAKKCARDSTNVDCCCALCDLLLFDQMSASLCSSKQVSDKKVATAARDVSYFS